MRGRLVRFLKKLNLKNGKYIIANLLDFFDLFSQDKFQNGLRFQKRILIFNWRDTKHKLSGGAEVYVHELAKRWVRDGHQVTVFCGNDTFCPRYEVIDGVEVIRRGGFYFVYVWAFLYYLVKFNGKYDVIIDCENGIPFFTPFYVRKPVYCVVHHVHQEIFTKYLNKPMAALASFLENKMMPWAYRNVQFITVSSSSKHDMEDLGILGKGIAIIHNGVDLDKLQPGKKSAFPTVLYLGRLKPYKSVDILIKAFEKVIKRSPMAKLIIAGCGEDEKKLKKLVTTLNLTEVVKFTGKVSETEKLELYQQAWVFANPSMIEGWGITTIEANACGTPVVASDVPGLRDSVNTPLTGFLVPYGDETELAEKILYLIENKKIRKDFSDAALLWSRNFDWNESAYQSLELISNKHYTPISKLLKIPSIDPLSTR